MGLNVDVRIDELVLHGFPAATGQRIADALQTELTRLLLREHHPNAPRPLAKRDNFDRDVIGAGIRLSHNATPERTGRALARTLHDSLQAAPSSMRAEPRGAGR